MLPSGTQKMLEVPSNSVETCLRWLVNYGSSFDDSRRATYGYQLRKLANRRVRYELKLHDGQRWSDGTGSKVGCKCIEAHRE